MANTQLSPSINIPISDTTELTCPECSKDTFDIVYKVLEMSKLSPHNPTKQDILKPIPYFRCIYCKHILKEGE